MSYEIVDGEKVGVLIQEKGWTRRHVIAQLGLGQDGYKFLRGEWMPKDEARKARLVATLAKMLGVQVGQILVRLRPVKAG
jgi:hypothetical protein